MSARQKAILVIDDERSIAEVIAAFLREQGYVADTASDGREALARLQERPYDAIMSDIRMPALNGLELYDEIARRYPPLGRRLIFMTGAPLDPAATTFLERAAVPCLCKPFPLDALQRLLRHLLAADDRP
jgi:CheY-like chemotaxis protein